MPSPERNGLIEILLVEDSPDDADLMREALLEGTLPLHVNCVEDGEQAMQFLRQQGPFQEAPRPDLILLDLRLPRMNGREVLEEIRRDVKLRCIPVVIMSANDAALPEMYEYHPNCCVTKPANQEEFRLAVKKIEFFWLNIAARVPKG